MKRTKEQFIDEVLFTEYSDFIYDIVTDRICICDLAEHSLALESWLAEQFTVDDLLTNSEEITKYASECLIAKSNTNRNNDNYIADLATDLIYIYKRIFNPSKRLDHCEKLVASSHLRWVPLAVLMEEHERNKTA